MKLGTYEIPEIRLMPQTLETLAKIYSVKHREKIPSKALALHLGYTYGTEPHFYRKLHSLTTYGLLEGKGTYQITELGESILHPRNDITKDMSKTKAVLNVALWKEIHTKYGKFPPQDNFWGILMDITKIEPDKAKDLDSKIYKWYTEDIAHVVEGLTVPENTSMEEQEETKSLSSKESNTKTVSQQLVSPEQEKLEFGGSVLLLPKKDLKKEWEKLQKYMKIYLEDYAESQHEELTSDE